MLRAVDRPSWSLLAGLAQLCLIALNSACGSPPAQTNPALMVEPYFQVGVLPGQETALMMRSLEASGWVVTQRITAPRFEVVALAHPDEGAQEIRVMTSRGVALRLETPAEDRSSGYFLPADAVAQGGEAPPHTLVIGRHDVVASRDCFEFFSVDDAGAVLHVPVRPHGAFLRHGCLVSASLRRGVAVFEALFPLPTSGVARIRLGTTLVSDGEVLASSFMPVPESRAEVPIAVTAVEAALRARFAGATSEAQFQAFAEVMEKAEQAPTTGAAPGSSAEGDLTRLPRAYVSLGDWVRAQIEVGWCSAADAC